MNEKKRTQNEKKILEAVEKLNDLGELEKYRKDLTLLYHRINYICQDTEEEIINRMVFLIEATGFKLIKL